MTEKQIQPTPEIYRGAIKELRKKGWCRHAYADSAGKLCIRGAWRKASGLDADPNCADPRADWPIRSHFETTVDDMAECFNNFTQGTVDDMCAALEIAACDLQHAT